jgi:hypothetical protein
MKAKNTIDISTVFENRNFNAKELAKTILANHLEEKLLTFALDKDHVISNRAMWVLNHCADINFESVKPFHLKLINHLKNKNLHSGVIRSVLGIFQEQPVPKKTKAFMLDKCYEYIKNPTEAIAARAYAMTIVFNISKPYPDLLQELSIVLTHLNITQESAAINAKVRNTLKAITKIKPKHF